MVDFSSLSSTLIAGEKENFGTLKRLKTALDIPTKSVSLEKSIFKGFARLAKDLAFSASRPAAEEQIATLFKLSGLSLFEFQELTLKKVFNEEILGSLVKAGLVAYEDKITEGIQKSQIEIIASPNSAQKALLGTLEEKWSQLLSAALKEVYLIALFSNQELRPLFNFLRSSGTEFNLPAIANENYIQPEISFHKIGLVDRIIDLDIRLSKLKLEALTESAEDPELTATLIDMFERPGLLFFEHGFRKQLRDQIGENRTLNAIITKCIHSIAGLLVVLENGIMDNHKQQRPDIYLYARHHTLFSLIQAFSRTEATEADQLKLAQTLQAVVDKDPSMGQSLNEAIIVDLPERTGRSAEKIAIKIFPVPDRSKIPTGGIANFVLSVPSSASGNPISALPQLMDTLGALDLRSRAPTLEKAARESLNLLLCSYSIFEAIINPNVFKINPAFEDIHKQAPLLQFANIWFMASSIEATYANKKISSYFLKNIHDWLQDYCEKASRNKQISLTEISGLSPFLEIIGDTYDKAHCIFSSNNRVQDLFEKYSQRIELLPTGLHALLSLIPKTAKNNLIYCLQAGNLIIDLPDLKSLRLLKRLPFKHLIQRIEHLRRNSGTAVRLSSLSSL